MIAEPAPPRRRRSFPRVPDLSPREVDVFGHLRHFGVPAEVVRRANTLAFRTSRAMYTLSVFGTAAIGAFGAYLARRADIAPDRAALRLLALSVAVVMIINGGGWLIRRRVPDGILRPMGQSVRALAAARHPSSAGSRRVLRRSLRRDSWQLAAYFAAAAGDGRYARNHETASMLSRWLCWASEDLDDVRRLDAALDACAAALLQVLAAPPRLPPRIPYPPRAAVLLRPMRAQRIADRLRQLRPGLLAIIPIVAAGIGLLAKSWGR
ncbi:hypothetical protein [Amycolatopsis magusensis]|uniref:hypothetical protein n=1 Tax=Amycolatopsis magusensis TaxID=882444 RepID=UPI003C2F6C07